MVDLYGTLVGRARSAIALVAPALVAATLVASPAAATHYTNTTELSATSNTGAAVAWSKATFPTAAAEVLLGRDDVFADSLASGSMQTSRPLLLTASQTLTAETDAELNRLKPGVVNILGGASAVSTGIENDLKSRGYTVRRFSGPTRLETAIDVARRNYQTATSAIIASAFAPPNSDPTRAFADSIAAGGWAAANGLPVLLTETDHLSTSTRNYLRGSLIRTVFIVGGEGAVSSTTEAELRQIGITVTRVAGATRFDTAVAIAKQRGFADAAKATEVILTEGQAADAWASGFASAAYAKAKSAPIVLSNNALLPDPTKTYLSPPGGAAGTKLVCGPRVQTDPCDSATSAMGHTSVTGSIPRLQSVTPVVSTTPGESQLQFKFSEPVSATVVAERFNLYTFDDIEIGAVSAARDASRPDVVNVQFPSAGYAESTTATVAYDAVRSATTGVQNMEGSAGVQAVSRTGGNSRGPNLVSIALASGETAPSGGTAAAWEVNFTYDKNVASCGAANRYVLVSRDADAASVRTFVGTSSPDQPSPTVCEVDFSVTAESGDTDGFAFSDIARGYVEGGTVSATGINGLTFPNPPTGTGGDTEGPDLRSFTVNASATPPTAEFTFDSDIQLATPTSGDTRNFKVYDSRGSVIEATGASVGSTNLSKVTVTFDPATTDAGLLFGVILGAAVESGAVQSRAGVTNGTPPTPTNALFNGAQEVPSSSVSTSSGRTTGPVLASVKRSASPGSTGTRITFAFNIRVDESTGGFFVYADDGERTQLTADQCAVDTQDQTKINCDVPTSAATSTAVKAALFGGLARDAVRPDDQAGLVGTSSPNPEAGMGITT